MDWSLFWLISKSNLVILLFKISGFLLLKQLLIVGEEHDYNRDRWPQQPQQPHQPPNFPPPPMPPPSGQPRPGKKCSTTDVYMFSIEA
jgi:hypothetical protein